MEQDQTGCYTGKDGSILLKPNPLAQSAVVTIIDEAGSEITIRAPELDQVYNFTKHFISNFPNAKLGNMTLADGSILIFDTKREVWTTPNLAENLIFDAKRQIWIGKETECQISTLAVVSG